MVKFGSNDFINFFVPFAFDGRYFIFEPGTTNPLISIVIEHEGKPVLEVFRNEPKENYLSVATMTPPGIISFAEISSGRFLYKVHPGTETSIMFATKEGDDNYAIITDHLIKVGGYHIKNNIFNGVSVGVLVDINGDIAIGGQIPPTIIQLLANRST